MNRLDQLRVIWVRIEAPARLGALALVVGLLAHDLWKLGPAKLLHNLPASPLFYLIFLINYLMLPVYESVIYRYLWKAGARVFPALLRKRVLNETVIEYAGETVFCFWAGKNLGLSRARAIRDVRDVNLLSTIAGSAVTLAIILVVSQRLGGLLPPSYAGLLHKAALLTGALALVLAGVLTTLRRRFEALSLPQSMVVLGIHTMRLGTYMALQALQWHFAVPSLGWGAWVVFLALQMAVTRLPFLPAKDLFFTALAIRLSGDVALDPGALAGAFVAGSGINLLIHAVMYPLSHVLAVQPSDEELASDPA